MSTEESGRDVAADETSVVNVGPRSLPSDVANRVVVAPWGEVASANGRFIVDSASSAEAVTAFESQGNDLPIDYEHQTLGGRYASPTGQAPAAGWIRRLEAVPEEGLVAHVEWTAPALSQLAARQYRYLSPVVIVRKRDRRLVSLHSAALTNKPAIARMAPIVNRSETTGIGSSDETTGVVGEDDLMDSALDGLRVRLALEPSADEETVLVAATERLGALEEALARQRAAETVAAVMKEGKLTSAQKEWAIELVMRDPEGFEAWLANAPVVVSHGQVAPPEDGSSAGSRRAPLVAGAMREFQSSDLLQSLTSEEAYVSDALREAGVA